MTATVYITRNGLLEPLGQSQVFAYLRGLSRMYQVTVITYEKDEDRADNQRLTALRKECERLGIRWLPQRFRPRPKFFAPALSMLRMGWLIWREVKGQDARLIHARSYIPATVAMVISRWTGVPFIFDMRALWPEELITARRMRRGSWLHKAMLVAERACLRRAATVVALTRASVSHLYRAHPEAMAAQRIITIPTCADLSRFVPAKRPAGQPVIGCLGTVLSGWFRLDWLAAFFAIVAQRDPSVHFEITTRDDPALVRAALQQHSGTPSKLNVAPCHSDRVHEVLQKQVASVMFYAGGELSELGRSPTRMAEILGCGLPVVANEGVGDVAQIIREHRVGVLVAGAAPAQMEAAYDALQELLVDPELARRCRLAAETIFSLEAGTAAYQSLYAATLEMGALSAKSFKAQGQI